MAQIEQKRQKNTYISGLVLLIVSAFLMLVLIAAPLLGPIGGFIRTFLYGSLGIASYGYFAATGVFGFFRMRQRRINLAKQSSLIIIGLFFLLLMIVHLVTSYKFLDGTFAEYSGLVYSAATAGGVVIGAIVYPIASVLGQPLSYTLFGLLALLLIFASSDFSVFRKSEPKIIQSPRRSDFYRTKPVPVQESISSGSLFVSEIIPPPSAGVNTAERNDGVRREDKQVSGLAQDICSAKEHNDNKYQNSGASNDGSMSPYQYAMQNHKSSASSSGGKRSVMDLIMNLGGPPADGTVGGSSRSSNKEGSKDKKSEKKRPQALFEAGTNGFYTPGGMSSNYGYGSYQGSSPQSPQHYQSTFGSSGGFSGYDASFGIKPKQQDSYSSTFGNSSYDYLFASSSAFRGAGNQPLSGFSGNTMDFAAAQADLRSGPPVNQGMFDNSSFNPSNTEYIHNPANTEYADMLNKPLMDLSGTNQQRIEKFGVSQVLPDTYKQPGFSAPKKEESLADILEEADKMPDPEPIFAKPKEQEPVKSTLFADNFLESYTVNSFEPDESTPIINGETRSKEIAEKKYTEPSYLQKGNTPEPVVQINTYRNQKPVQDKAEDIFASNGGLADMTSFTVDGSFMHNADKPKDDSAAAFKSSLSDDSFALPKSKKTADDLSLKSKAVKTETEDSQLSTETEDAPKDFTGSYFVIPKEKKSKFLDNVDVTESHLQELRKKVSLRKSQEGQIGIDEYLSETLRPVIPPVKPPRRYNSPSVDLLDESTTFSPVVDDECRRRGQQIVEVLNDFKIPVEVTDIKKAPAVTRYELRMPPGIPVNKISQRADDIQYKLAANGGVRVEAPIAGKTAVGIEVPNRTIDIVSLRDILCSEEFRSSKSLFTFAVGRDVEGHAVVGQLEKMPHLLVAGSTNSGKSCCLNSLITSLCFKASPEDLRIILIDPKRVEFVNYRGLPHMLLEKPITDTDAAINALQWAIDEAQNRFNMLSQYHYRDLLEYNNSKDVKEGRLPRIPVIVIIVDELAELMNRARRDIEDRINSLSAIARAAGINLVLATQRPSVDVITGTIKNNIPSRIAFSVTNLNDSRTIIDQPGAEMLLGRGDMLYEPQGAPAPKRIQGAYITSDEVNAVVAHIKLNNPAEFDPEIERRIYTVKTLEDEGMSDSSDGSSFDEELPLVLKFFIEKETASTSLAQRKFSMGYNKAARIVEKLEEMKLISPADGSKPRKVLISMEQFTELFGE